MYRGVDYIDTTGDGQTNEVDIYYWPTADPNNPQLLGTAVPVTLDDGTDAWNFSYTLDIQDQIEILIPILSSTTGIKPQNPQMVFSNGELY